MSNAEYIRQLMLTCPHLSASPLEMHIDQTGQSPTNYSVESAPNDPTIKTYLNGDALKVYGFALTSRREFFTDDDRSENAAAYEKVARWMSQQSRSGQLPAMDDGKRPMKLIATGSGYVLEQDEDMNSAIYMMQAQLTYYQEV